MKGEFIGLAVCILTTLTMIVMSLFMPGHGFFTGSGYVNAETLKNLIASVDSLLSTNKPKDSENPPQAVQVSLASDVIKDRDKYQLTALFVPADKDLLQRRVPTV